MTSKMVADLPFSLFSKRDVGDYRRYTVVAECVSDGSPLLASTFTFSKMLKYNGTRSPAAQQFMPRLEVV